MRNLKLLFWILVVGFLAILVFQNQKYFLATNSLRINLLVVDEYFTPELSNAVLLVSSFILGFLIYFFYSLSSRFKTKKTIKSLNATIDEKNKKISALEAENSSLKASAQETVEIAPAEEIPAETVDEPAKT